MPKSALKLVFEWMDLHKPELLETGNYLKMVNYLKKLNL